MAVYQNDFTIEHKSDGSPLTTADLAAQDIIEKSLSTLEPAYPIVSEEASPMAWDQRREWSRYWLVDPLDGTCHFARRDGEFSVNIALIDRHRSVLGVVLAPITGQLFVAAQGRGAWRQLTEGSPWERLSTQALAHPARVMVNRSYDDAREGVLRRLVGGDYRKQLLGSSLKSCLIAAGEADLYLRFGATSQWDTAASQCVLEEAGGVMLDMAAGNPLSYNRSASLLNSEFIAAGDKSVDWMGKLHSTDLAYSPAKVP